MGKDNRAIEGKEELTEEELATEKRQERNRHKLSLSGFKVLPGNSEKGEPAVLQTDGYHYASTAEHYTALVKSKRQREELKRLKGELVFTPLYNSSKGESFKSFLTERLESFKADYGLNAEGANALLKATLKALTLDLREVYEQEGFAFKPSSEAWEEYEKQEAKELLKIAADFGLTDE